MKIVLAATFLFASVAVAQTAPAPAATKPGPYLDASKIPGPQTGDASIATPSAPATEGTPCVHCTQSAIKPIAVINLQLAVYETKKGQAAELASLAAHAPEQQNLRRLAAEIDAANDALGEEQKYKPFWDHTKAEAAVHNAEARKAKAEAALRDEYAADRAAVFADLIKDIADTARDYCETKVDGKPRYGMLLDVTPRGNDKAHPYGNPVVGVTSGEDDITSAVAAAYDAAHP